MKPGLKLFVFIRRTIQFTHLVYTNINSTKTNFELQHRPKPEVCEIIAHTEAFEKITLKYTFQKKSLAKENIKKNSRKETF